MALIGMAIYSATYAVMYAATSNAAVPVLEMWMVTTHLACAILSLLFCIVMDNASENNNMASSIFLGVACSVTILGSDCINATQASEGLYFGAAATPKLAAAGAIAWAWIMYVSSFHSIPDTFVSALVMCMVPLAVEAKIITTCGDKWHALLQGDMIWGRVATAATLVIAAAFLNKGVLVLQPVVMWIMQPHSAKVTASPLPYYIVTSALVLISFFKSNKKSPLLGTEKRR
jgi:hypothetical protein